MSIFEKTTERRVRLTVAVIEVPLDTFAADRFWAGRELTIREADLATFDADQWIADTLADAPLPKTDTGSEPVREAV